MKEISRLDGAGPEPQRPHDVASLEDGAPAGAATEPTAAPARRGRRAAAVVAGVVGELLITMGVVVLLFTGYQVWFTNVETARAQKGLTTELRETWSDPKPPATVKGVPLGYGLAVLRAPRFGRDWAKVVVEGVRTADLRKGPGHYPGTAQPGEVGNFVVSGHRTTYGAPFANIDALRAGDAVVVETQEEWFTYVVTTHEIVSPRDVGVILPVPRQEDARPRTALMTMTSCHPRYSAKQRYIVFLRLAERHDKTAGYVPPALA